ncbi:MAG: hypothetical protein K1X61_08495 [Chitinophagales bacterium]|nr:hypothetical protein [Chitinophagales bacterium]
MKKVLYLTLLLAFAGIQFSHAQISAESAMKTYTKTKNQFDGLTAKYKPYKDMAIQNADKLSPELQSSMKDLDLQMTGFGDKLDAFPKASSTEQIAMASSLTSDFSKIKSSTKSVTKSIKGMKLPAMPKL